MVLDQEHEQLSALDKVDGEAGLIGNPATLRRRMVAGPETSRMIQEFECHSIHSLTVDPVEIYVTSDTSKYQWHDFRIYWSAHKQTRSYNYLNR